MKHQNSEMNYQLSITSYDGNLFQLIGNTKEILMHKISEHSLKSIDASPKYLAVAGYDERIHLVKMISKKGMVLEAQAGSIVLLKLYNDQYVFSVAEDKTICIWKIDPAVLLHTLKYKGGDLIDLAVYHDGKAMLTLHKGGRVMLWNLMSGHHIYEKDIIEAIKIDFIQDNKFYYLVGNTILKVLSLKDETIIEDIKIDESDKALAASHYGNEIFIGMEKGKGIICIEIGEEGKETKRREYKDLWKGKIKAMDIMKNNEDILVGVVTVEGEALALNIDKKDCIILLKHQFDSIYKITNLAISQYGETPKSEKPKKMHLK